MEAANTESNSGHNSDTTRRSKGADNSLIELM